MLFFLALGLDLALGVGGYPRGRVIEIYGPESSGKTTLTLHAIAECQKAGGIAAFIDAEHAFDRFYAEKLGIDESQYITSFQSRLAAAGREWLKPYTSELMKKLPKEGVKKILILSPGFSMDCLETIEEIDEENKEIFIDAGGKTFNYVSCLNDSDLHVSFIKNFLNKQISIWK